MPGALKLLQPDSQAVYQSIARTRENGLSVAFRLFRRGPQAPAVPALLDASYVSDLETSEYNCATGKIARSRPSLRSLTMYRPNFCAECGAQVVRLHWRVWTSRRFCDHCAPGFLRSAAAQLAVATLMVFFVGLVIGRAVRPAIPPLMIQRSSSASSAEVAAKAGSRDGVNVTASSSGEEVYLCGARTKKGTPCSRRVHGPVRCWQHKGRPAMLPPEKLMIKE